MLQPLAKLEQSGGRACVTSYGAAGRSWRQSGQPRVLDKFPLPYQVNLAFSITLTTGFLAQKFLIRNSLAPKCKELTLQA